MFLIPGIAALFVFVYVRPHEIVDVLRPFTLGPILAFVALGHLIDVKVGASRLRVGALLPWAVAFFVWCFTTIVINAPEVLAMLAPVLGASLLLFLTISQGVQNLRALGATGGALLILTVVLAGIGVHQGLSPTVCVSQMDVDMAGDVTAKIDGRPCELASDCRQGGPAGMEYVCEHVGVLQTYSIGGRVRFRGILEDPNELSWAISLALPLAFFRYGRKRNFARLATVVVVFGLTLACVIMTESRSGQLTLIAVVGFYFVRRFGWRGILAAAPLAIPIMLLGGRSGEAADASTQERLECWVEALEMWRSHPFFGVGARQFTEHHFLTAHSSFMLTLAELGPIGLVLWSLAIYGAFKIAIRVQIDFADRPETAVAREWAATLVAILAGMVVSAFFLSIAYHPVLWIEIGLAGALYASVRRHSPEWSVSIGPRDLLLVAGFDAALVISIKFYLAFKGM